MSDFKMKSISNIKDLRKVNVGACIFCSEPINELGMPYAHDLNTNTIKTIAKIVYESKNDSILDKGYVARPVCGNIACINPEHIKLIKA